MDPLTYRQCFKNWKKNDSYGWNNIKILLFPRRGVGTVAASASLPGRLCAGLSLEDGVQLV